MNSLVENKEIPTYQLFSNDQTKLVYCIDAKKAPKIYNSISQINKNNNCNDICFSKTRKIIIEKKKCIDDCSKDNKYKYEYALSKTIA